MLGKGTFVSATEARAARSLEPPARTGASSFDRPFPRGRPTYHPHTHSLSTAVQFSPRFLVQGVAMLYMQNSSGNVEPDWYSDQARILVASASGESNQWPLQDGLPACSRSPDLQIWYKTGGRPSYREAGCWCHASHKEACPPHLTHLQPFDTRFGGFAVGHMLTQPENSPIPGPISYNLPTSFGLEELGEGTLHASPHLPSSTILASAALQHGVNLRQVRFFSLGSGNDPDH